LAQPLYQQIADDLCKRIESGSLGPGQQLPTELELRDTYNASRNTIRDAIKRLMSLGLVETRPGAGTYVTERIDPFVTVLTTPPVIGSPNSDFAIDDSADPEGASYLSMVGKSHRKAACSPVRVEVRPAPKSIASRLRIPSGAPVVARHQERYIDDSPWSVQTTFYPMEFVTSGLAPRLLMADDIPEGTVRYLEDALGCRQVGYRDWITARGPDSSEQQFFGIGHDCVVLELFRTGFDEGGSPMRVTVTVYPADRNQFIVNSGEVPSPSFEQDESI